ncbi:hypothetical protein SAMN05920897_10913 [Alkalispirochaeta americana]|uniref:Uncharacterized protein n=1 Tax=Alkalispirochaeta americana TaxID=159291 RepID=A0A1N6SV63_9SPIO|nr:hypothetical protein SAMN05920897_10913 [Alkalispirochaeta americana]
MFRSSGVDSDMASSRFLDKLMIIIIFGESRVLEERLPVEHLLTATS